MKLISWNLAGRTNKVAAQVEALALSQPDIVALQEVTVQSSPLLRSQLAQIGLSHAVDGFQQVSFETRPRKYRQIVASRYPVTASDRVFPIAWSEAALAVEIDSPHGTIELYNCHIPPGSKHGWMKIETLEGIYRGLAVASTSPRILCGDFNTPIEERSDGTVITAGQRIDSNGRIYVQRRKKGRPGEGWDAAERSILTGLAEHDLADVFRRLNGYKVADFSWRFRRNSTIVERRFDHVFASAALNPIACSYLQELREAGLSDHSPIEAVFDINRS